MDQNESLFTFFGDAVVKVPNILQLLEGQFNDTVLFLYRREQ